MRFLVDAELPPSLADWLIGKGHAAAHLVSTVGVDASDAQVWDLAIASDYIIVTKDRDFVEWARTRTPKARILWVRFGNMRREAFQARLDAVWPELEGVLARDTTVIEVGG